MMDEFALESYLHDHIPLTKHLGVRVTRASAEAVELSTLEPNPNHRRTGFGGSISAVAILAGWGLLWCRLRGRAAGHNIVIQRNTIEYSGIQIEERLRRATSGARPTSRAVRR